MSAHGAVDALTPPAVVWCVVSSDDAGRRVTFHASRNAAAKAVRRAKAAGCDARAWRGSVVEWLTPAQVHASGTEPVVATLDTTASTTPPVA